MHAAAAADTVVLARSSTVPVVPVVLYRYIYTSSGARATFRHHARAEEALQYSSLIATEELTELLKPVCVVLRAPKANKSNPRVGSSYARLGRSVAPLCINRCIAHSGVWLPTEGGACLDKCRYSSLIRRGVYRGSRI